MQPAECRSRFSKVCIRDWDIAFICVRLQVFFAATGVSDGDLLRGVRYYSGGASTNSIVMRASSGTGAPSLLVWLSG